MAKLCKTLPLLHWFHGSTTENSAACSLPGLPPWPSYVDELSWHTLPWPHPLVLFHVAPCFSHKDLTKKSAFVTFVHWFQHISNHFCENSPWIESRLEGNIAVVTVLRVVYVNLENSWWKAATHAMNYMVGSLHVTSSTFNFPSNGEKNTLWGVYLGMTRCVYAFRYVNRMSTTSTS